MNEILKRHFEINKVRDTQTDKAGADETTKNRTVIMETVDGRKITLEGAQDQIIGFIPGENVEVRITSMQQQLFNVEPEVPDEEVSDGELPDEELPDVE